MQSFSNRLIALRKERGYTQHELAKVLNFKRSTVSGYETEGKEPDFETLCTFAEFFGVTTDYMLGISNVRTHNDVLFVNDTKNFASTYETLPAEHKQLVASMFDKFYLLLSRDMKQRKISRLELYDELFSLIQTKRADIRNCVESGNLAKDPVALSNLMTTQTDFKNEVSVLLDKLLQADMGVHTQKESLASSEKSAI